MTEGALVLIEELPIPVEDLWALWTETDRVSKWLAAGATIDLRVGGTYELSGHLGDKPLGEPIGGPIVGLEEEYVIKVTWRLPADLGPSVSEASPATTLGVWFQPLGPNRTRIRLEHDGWRDGEDWATARQWQADAWTSVLSRLKQGSLPA
jgi:uncharacterized protein YndB with AHSA1/START domain